MARRTRGYDDAQARQIFRDLIDMPAAVAITDHEIRVRRCAHLPIVFASAFPKSYILANSNSLGVNIKTI
jgi:hypothetical protein